MEIDGAGKEQRKREITCRGSKEEDAIYCCNWW